MCWRNNICVGELLLLWKSAANSYKNPNFCHKHKLRPACPFSQAAWSLKTLWRSKCLKSWTLKLHGGRKPYLVERWNNVEDCLGVIPMATKDCLRAWTERGLHYAWRRIAVGDWYITALNHFWRLFLCVDIVSIVSSKLRKEAMKDL